MRLIGRDKDRATRLDHEVSEIRARVLTMRARLTRRDVELADLFALVGEHDGPVTGARQQTARPPAPRVWPDEVPGSLEHSHSEPKVTYGDWELMRRPGPFTVR